MNKKFLTPQGVADRYCGAITVKTLANWRSARSGPPYTKINGKVVYPLSDLEAWETARTKLASADEHAVA